MLHNLCLIRIEPFKKPMEYKHNITWSFARKWTQRLLSEFEPGLVILLPASITTRIHPHGMWWDVTVTFTAQILKICRKKKKDFCESCKCYSMCLISLKYGRSTLSKTSYYTWPLAVFLLLPNLPSSTILSPANQVGCSLLFHISLAFSMACEF